MDESYYRKVKKEVLEEILATERDKPEGLYFAHEIGHLPIFGTIAKHPGLEAEIDVAVQSGNTNRLREIGKLYTQDLDYSKNRQSLKSSFFIGVEAYKQADARGELVQIGDMALQHEKYAFAFEAYLASQSKDKLRELIIKLGDKGKITRHGTFGQILKYAALHTGNVAVLEKYFPEKVKELVREHLRKKIVQSRDNSKISEFGDWDVAEFDFSSASRMYLLAGVSDPEYRVGERALLMTARAVKEADDYVEKTLVDFKAKSEIGVISDSDPLLERYFASIGIQEKIHDARQMLRDVFIKIERLEMPLEKKESLHSIMKVQNSVLRNIVEKVKSLTPKSI